MDLRNVISGPDPGGSSDPTILNKRDTRNTSVCKNLAKAEGEAKIFLLFPRKNTRVMGVEVRTGTSASTRSEEKHHKVFGKAAACVALARISNTRLIYAPLLEKEAWAAEGCSVSHNAVVFSRETKQTSRN